MKSVIGLLFAAAIFATVPISAQVTPRGLELSVDRSEGHHLRARPSSSAAGGEDASFDKSDGLSVAATNPVRTPTPLLRNRRGACSMEGLSSAAREPISAAGSIRPNGGRLTEQSDHWKRTRACPRRGWPRRRGAADECDELASPHGSLSPRITPYHIIVGVPHCTKIWRTMAERGQNEP